jgi:hypothetical protein
LFFVSLPSTAQVLHQDLCSKETEGEKYEEKGRENRKLHCGKQDKLIKEEAKDVHARPHSGIRLFVINEVNKDSMEEDYEDEGSTEEDNNKESNNAEDKNADSVRTGSSGFLVSSPDNDCKGGIDSMIGGGGPIDPQSSCGIGNNDSNKDYTQQEACIGHDGLSVFPHNCKFCLFYKRK